MIRMNDVLPVVELRADQIALLSAAIARVAGSEAQKFNAREDVGILEIEKALDSEINVYDRGDSRYIVFFFQYATIEVKVRARPAKPNAPVVPTDDPPGGTPGATETPRFAAAA